MDITDLMERRMYAASMALADQIERDLLLGAMACAVKVKPKHWYVEIREDFDATPYRLRERYKTKREAASVANIVDSFMRQDPKRRKDPLVGLEQTVAGYVVPVSFTDRP